MERVTDDGTAERITATELARTLSEVLSRVRYRGERFVVERNGEAVAEISPAQPNKPLTLSNFVEWYLSLPRPDDKFADDLEEIQLAQPPMPPPVEWPSSSTPA